MQPPSTTRSSNSSPTHHRHRTTQQPRLVNVETLIWLDTTKTVDLGTTPLLGHHINLIATVQTVTWNFGDHHTDTTTRPGRPFLTTDHCATLTCPGWYGHTYTTTGTMTLTATITWTGRYNIDNGPYHPITGTVTTTPTTTTCTSTNPCPSSSPTQRAAEPG